ncbi:hypothetical protein Slin14017_G000840 [Septoria linicola]|nr:hypothetical protein Slin14017_G000840 [Septoria linicola]
MIVPDLTGVAKAIKQVLNTSTLATPTTDDATNMPQLSETRTWLGRSRTRGLSRASAALEAAFGAEGKQASDQQSSVEIEDVEKRQVAQTSVVVGAPVATTRTTTIRSTSTIQQTTVVENGTTRTESSSVSVVTRTVTQSASTTSSGTVITASASLTGTRTTVATAPVSTATAPLASPPPTCPGASLDQFTDSAGITYLIKCSTTNSGAVYELVKVDNGGYGQCFSSCSNRADCVGFNYVGTDSGICYLRNVQSSDNDNTALVGSYVTCYKVDPSATPTPESGSGGRSSNVGAIAGGVVGGVLGLILLLAIIALFVRRHRRKVDERREKRSVSRPVPPPQDRYYDGIHQSTNVASISSNGHHRTGSTAKDMYTSQGGAYFMPSQQFNHTRQRSFALGPIAAKKSADPFGELTGDRTYGSNASPYAAEPGARAEGGAGVPKAGAYRRAQMLDGTPVEAGSRLKQSGSKSIMFVEHMVEMEDTSSRRSPIAQESPVLGRNSPRTDSAKDVRRNQHIMAWNRPDGGSDAPMSANLTPRTPPAARSKASSTSPGKAGLPREASFVVSPLRSVTSSRATGVAPGTLGSGVYKP